MKRITAQVNDTTRCYPRSIADAWPDVRGPVRFTHADRKLRDLLLDCAVATIIGVTLVVLIVSTF